jgi:hypothetical protein
MPCLGTTETIQRVGLLDLTSITERTIPVTGNPFNITVASSPPRYWARRQRRASARSLALRHVSLSTRPALRSLPITPLNLQGFSNDQRKQFFTKRLKSPEERDIANRVAREVGERVYEGDVIRKELQADRASGVPLLLELVALYVDGKPGDCSDDAQSHP